jgi:Ca2+-binding RTX toxin-like protein
MRRLGTGVAVLTLSLATATPSLAAKAEVAGGSSKYGGYSILYVTAAPGERNEIVVTESGGALRVTDSSPVTVGGSCDAQPDGSAVCQGSQQRPLTELRVDAGDLDDSVRIEFGRVYLSGGDGKDTLAVIGLATVVFAGGSGDDRMTGGVGLDFFREGSGANGSDVMMGGSPPDSSGSFANTDKVSYADRVNPVHADLEGDADDGEAGEHDQIGADVESIRGGAGADLLAGTAGPNSLDAGLGADRVLAGAGPDYVSGRGGDDVLYGGLGNDRVFGGPGRDRMRPGKGLDAIFGGAGNDILWTLDGRGENIECGGGWDRILPDPFSDTRKQCERVLRPRRAARA